MNTSKKTKVKEEWEEELDNRYWMNEERLDDILISLIGKENGFQNFFKYIEENEFNYSISYKVVVACVQNMAVDELHVLKEIGKWTDSTWFESDVKKEVKKVKEMNKFFCQFNKYKD